MVDSARTDCGMEVVRWIVAHRPTIGLIYLHSFNINAAFRMGTKLAKERLENNAPYRVWQCPFSATKLSEVAQSATERTESVGAAPPHIRD